MSRPHANPTPRAPVRAAAAARVAALAVLLAGAGAAEAQYKIIGPDGKVTYTDRVPTSSAQGRVVPLNGREAPAAAAEASAASLPFELRSVVGKYPVTLYTIAGACDPCAAARQLLRQRGVPYAERQVVSAEDGDALERLTGGRDAPTLTIGTQTLRGLAAETWSSYLEAAGYPRESRLPAGYQYRAAVPIVERREASVQAPAPAAAVTRPPAPAVPPPAPGGIRF